MEDIVTKKFEYSDNNANKLARKVLWLYEFFSQMWTFFESMDKKELAKEKVEVVFKNDKNDRTYKFYEPICIGKIECNCEILIENNAGQKRVGIYWKNYCMFSCDISDVSNKNLEFFLAVDEFREQNSHEIKGSILKKRLSNTILLIRRPVRSDDLENPFCINWSLRRLDYWTREFENVFQNFKKRYADNFDEPSGPRL